MLVNNKSLNQNVKMATIWLVLASFSNQFLRLISNLILTRLLVPEHFGVMAIVILIWTGLNLLTDAGLQQSVVRSSTENLNKILPTIFSVQLIRGFGIFIIVVLVALLSIKVAPLSFFSGTIYSLPEFSNALLIISLAPLVAGFQSPGIYLLQRNFQQKKLFAIEFLSQVLGFLSALVLYYVYGNNIVVLAFSAVVSIFSKVVMSYFISHYSVVPGFCRESALQIWNYGKWIVLSSIMGFLLLGADRFLLSFNLDADVLGVYAIAAFILVSLKEVVSKFFIVVYFSALSHLQNSDGDLVLYYQKSKPRIDAILIALSLIIFLSAESFIALLYDERYVYAGFILSVLSFTILGKSSEVVLQLLLVKGNSRFVALYNGLSVPICYMILLIGLYYYSFKVFLIMFVGYEILRYLSSIFIEKFYIGKPCVDVKVLLFGGAAGGFIGISADFIFSNMARVLL